MINSFTHTMTLSEKIRNVIIFQNILNLITIFLAIFVMWFKDKELGVFICLMIQIAAIVFTSATLMTSY